MIEFLSELMNVIRSFLHSSGITEALMDSIPSFIWSFSDACFNLFNLPIHAFIQSRVTLLIDGMNDQTQLLTSAHRYAGRNSQMEWFGCIAEVLKLGTIPHPLA